MKKAVIEQFLLGFILVFATMTFVATVGDEIATRNKAKNIQELALQTAKTMSIGYNQTINMCWAKNRAEDILLESSLGRELLQLQKTNPNDFVYEYYDLLPLNADGTIGDNQPDQVRVSVSNYNHETFWYKLFKKDSFSISNINKLFAVDAPMSLSIDYGGGVSGNDNMLGTYQLDQNGCVTNTTVFVEAQSNYATGTSLATNIQSPPTFFFIIPNGGRNFPNARSGSTITIEPQHCQGTSNTHRVTIAGTRRDNQKVHFQHNDLNGNNDVFVQAIPANVWDIYNDIVEPAEGKRSTLNEFLAFCETDEFQELIKPINEDNDRSNDIIDCTTDINNQYKYGFEDWDNGDDDYNDVFLNGTQFIIPNSQDQYTVEQDTRRIVFDPDYCETDPLNNPPNLTLQNCPITIDEDNPATITWTASDSDGTVVSTSVMSQNANASVSMSGNVTNTSGTITYQPEENFFGQDTITALATDDDGAIARRDCIITVNEVNDPPTITGAPLTTIKPNDNYIFRPVADDPDGDALTFSIQNRPSWLNFNTQTGELSGTPTNSDLGIYSNIIITVSDGRGGVAQLPIFSIQVTNQGPTLGSPIPDQEVKQYEIFTYNVSPHFSDPDGDPLTYTILATIDGIPVNWLSITNDGQITSIKIPSGYVGKNIVTTVTASDGISSVSDTFNILIKNNNSVPIYTHDFEVDKENWQNYTRRVYYDGSHRLRVKYRGRQNSATFWAYNNTYDFGATHGNMDVKITFKLHHVGSWGAGNTFKVGWPGGFSQNYTFNGTGGPIDITATGRTRSDGRMYVLLQLTINDKNNYIYVDDMRIELK